ncbi:DNA methyltransferase [Acinetobacter baumannii]|uniref:DNA methyltransferase n=1 Tax=Acinetobacter baumannii TaxID=470 RepID=UPI003EDEFB51
MNKILFGDCRALMKQMIEEGLKAQTCVTSPPYFGLRDYGVDGQLGLENTVDEYVQNMVEVFRLVRELLHEDGTLWLNLGDSYAGSGRGMTRTGLNDGKNPKTKGLVLPKQNAAQSNLKPKDLIGIPWKVAFAYKLMVGICAKILSGINRTQCLKVLLIVVPKHMSIFSYSVNHVDIILTT